MVMKLCTVIELGKYITKMEGKAFVTVIVSMVTTY